MVANTYYSDHLVINSEGGARHQRAWSRKEKCRGLERRSGEVQLQYLNHDAEYPRHSWCMGFDVWNVETSGEVLSE